jgi:hypothetical protein
MQTTAVPNAHRSSCLYASWLMRLPSFCALIAGAMYVPPVTTGSSRRLPVFDGACFAACTFF